MINEKPDSLLAWAALVSFAMLVIYLLLQDTNAVGPI